jgi:hypothetical protein
MLLTITTTCQPATGLGYLLHKNPARVQSFSLSFGQAHVFYPEASNEPPRRAHECAFGVLARESEPVNSLFVRGETEWDFSKSCACAIWLYYG